MIGTLISKFKEKLWDIDINNLTVSHLENKACIRTRVVCTHNLKISGFRDRPRRGPRGLDPRSVGRGPRPRQGQC